MDLGISATPDAGVLRIVMEPGDGRPLQNDYEGRSVAVGLSDDFEIALGRRLMALIETRAPKLRLIFRQIHSQIVARALMERTIDLAIASGGFADRLISRHVLGEGGYLCLVDPASLREGQHDLTLQAFVEREHILISSGGFIGIVDESLANPHRQKSWTTGPFFMRAKSHQDRKRGLFVALRRSSCNFRRKRHKRWTFSREWLEGISPNFTEPRTKKLKTRELTRWRIYGNTLISEPSLLTRWRVAA
jgi:hypothetical protein